MIEVQGNLSPELNAVIHFVVESACGDVRLLMTL